MLAGVAGAPNPLVRLEPEPLETFDVFGTLAGLGKGLAEGLGDGVAIGVLLPS